MDELFLYPFQFFLYLAGYIFLKIFSFGKLKIEGLDNRKKYRYTSHDKSFEFKELKNGKRVSAEWIMLAGLIVFIVTAIVIAVTW